MNFKRVLDGGNGTHLSCNTTTPFDTSKTFPQVPLSRVIYLYFLDDVPILALGCHWLTVLCSLA